MKAFITKYALTSGIKEIEGRISRVSPKMFVSGYGSYHANEWHIYRASAIARAEEMRVSKIASLKKQIAKLEKLKFQ